MLFPALSRFFLYSEAGSALPGSLETREEGVANTADSLMAVARRLTSPPRFKSGST